MSGSLRQIIGNCLHESKGDGGDFLSIPSYQNVPLPFLQGVIGEVRMNGMCVYCK